MAILEHLRRVAAEITDNSLAGIKTKQQWLSVRPLRYRQYLEMQGVARIPPQKDRTDLEVRVTGTVERDDVIIEKLHFQSLPRLYVTANLYIPKGLTSPAPAVVYVCGHSNEQKTHYQAHPRRWAQLGFVTLIVETLQFGEIAGYHHGCYRYGQFQWYSRGYTPAGVEMYNAIRAADLLQGRPEVDGEKIGITGISGGGATSWWAGAADERFKAVAPVCGTGSVKAHLKDRTWDDHCDCMMFINTYRQELSDCGALIAPRPLMVASADRDGIYSIESIRETYARIKGIYDLYGCSEDCQLVETPGPHSYHERSRTGIFSFFLKHLAGKNVPPEQIEDISEPLETSETLRVFVTGLPAGERTSTIQDSFVPTVKPPDIADENALAAHKADVITRLKEKTFGHFPQKPCDLDVAVDYEYMNGQVESTRLAFSSEQDIRLHAKLVRPATSRRGDRAPVLVFLKSSGADRWQFDSFTEGMDLRWARLAVECRGVGETSWGRQLQWHIRRSAAITGRTIASMQVYDALRAIEMLRAMDCIDGERIAIAGTGQMAVVAIYAALLDGRMEAVIVGNPPATQNAPDQPDSPDVAIEMLNCLRITDLPVAAGLLLPADLVFTGPCPISYRWAEELYNRLGGRVYHVKDIGQYPARISRR